MIEPRPELSKLSDYVPGKSIEEIRERFGLDKVVKLASNENPLGASPKAVEAFHGIADSLHLYPRGDAPKLIDSIAKMYGVATNEIVIGNGSDEIIDMVGKAFIRQGDNCVGITPTFSVYKFTTLSNGADFTGVGEGEARTSLDELAKAINDKTRVAFICNPNNPTGAYNMAKFVSEYPNLFVNRTFSKIYGLAGLRVGYAFGSTEVIRALWKVKPPFDVNQAAQVAAIAALGDKEHVQATRKMNTEGIAVLTREFNALGLKVLPTQANFICVKIGERAKELVAFLESNGMIVRGLTSFGMSEYIRVTVGKPEENAFLMELVKKWCEA